MKGYYWHKDTSYTGRDLFAGMVVNFKFWALAIGFEFANPDYSITISIGPLKVWIGYSP